MKLFYDLRLGYFVSAPGVDSELTELYAKAGDTEEVIVQFGRSSDPTSSNSIIESPTWTAENLAGGTVITIGIKEDGEYSDGTILATTSSFTHNATDKLYTFALGLNTTAINTALERLDANAADDVAELDCQFEITFQIGGSGGWRSSVLPVPFNLYHDIIGGSEGTPTNAADPTQYLLKTAGVEYLPTVTSKIGGTSSDLDAVPTTSVTVGKMVQFRDLDSTPVLRVYELASGTDAESSPDVIRPDDYNASTNAKVWKLQSLASAGSGIGGSTGATDNAILRADGAGGATAQASGITIADGATGTLSGTNSGDVTLAASVTDILTVTGQDLSADDPGADRIVFWDDSASKLTHLTVGTGLSISGTTITNSGVLSIAASAGDILSVSGSDIVADDPNADRIVFWDDSASKLTHLTPGTGLQISGTTINCTASGGAPSGLEVQTSGSLNNGGNGKMYSIDAYDPTLSNDSVGGWGTNAMFWLKKHSATSITIIRDTDVALWYNGTDGDLIITDDRVYQFYRESSNTWRIISKT